MDAELIDVKTTHSSIEDVNNHLLDKLDELIDSVNGKDPEMVRAITESVAKLNTSLKGNNIFTPRETDEETKQRQAQEAILGAMKGE